MRRTAAILFGFVLLATPLSAEAQRANKAARGCVTTLGRKEMFGSAEQIQELQRRVRAVNVNACPALGFRFTAGPRTATVLYDRQTGTIVRVARWQGDSGLRWDLWTGVTDASILRDPATGSIEAGTYYRDRAAESRIPATVRRAIDRYLP